MAGQSLRPMLALYEVFLRFGQRNAKRGDRSTAIAAYRIGSAVRGEPRVADCLVSMTRAHSV